VVRLAAGDVERAARELFHHADAAPPDERADLLAEAFETVLALRNAGLLPAGSEELVRRLELCSWKQAE
jgi:hypothetical protein